MKTRRSESPGETVRIAEIFAGEIEIPAVLCLTGQLGSGKTTFTKGLGRGVGYEDWKRIKSPSYTIVNHYEAGVSLYHIDLYRLSSPVDIESLGILDLLSEENFIASIEWAEKIDRLDHKNIFQVQFEIIGDTERKITFK